MNCGVDKNFALLLCNDWNIKDYCDTANMSNTFLFKSDVPMAKISWTNGILTFHIDKISLPNGTDIDSAECPSNKNISASCNVECDDYSLNSMIVQPAIDDEDVYDSYQFWFFLLFMVLAWIGQAIAVSIGDAICFEMLGKHC